MKEAGSKEHNQDRKEQTKDPEYIQVVRRVLMASQATIYDYRVIDRHSGGKHVDFYWLAKHPSFSSPRKRLGIALGMPLLTDYCITPFHKVPFPKVFTQAVGRS